MGVLAEDQRHRRPLRRALDDGGRRRVHERVDVGVRAAARRAPAVVDGPAGVPGFEPLIAGREVRAVAGLVAHRPDHHRRVVLVALDHPLDAIQVRRPPGWVVGEPVLHVVAITVALDVRLVDDVEAVEVAELVPLGVVRVVRGADGVHVVLLHQLDVADHQRAIEVVAGVGAVLVAVDALEERRLPVDQDARVPDLDLAEADPRRDHLDHPARAVLERQPCGVEIGRVGRPFERRAHRHQELRRHLLAGRHVDLLRHRGAHGLSGRIEQLERDAGSGARGPEVAHGDRSVERAVLVRQVEGAAVLEIADVDGRPAPEEDVAEDAAQPEHVLVLEERAVAPPVDLDGERVRTRPDEASDVEFRRRAAVLAVADARAVDPEVECRVDAREVQEDAAADPVRRDRERRPVGADRVVLTRHPRVGGVEGERVLYVRVDRHPEPLHLPVAGHGDGRPGPVVELGPLEAGGAAGGVGRVPGTSTVRSGNGTRATRRGRRPRPVPPTGRSSSSRGGARCQRGAPPGRPTPRAPSSRTARSLPRRPAPAFLTPGRRPKAAASPTRLPPLPRPARPPTEPPSS